MDDQNTLRYFGEDWGAPVLEGAERIDLPDMRCGLCNEQFKQGDDGVVMVTGLAAHKECWLRSTVGGINHLKKTCSCYGGDDPTDPPELSRFEAAKVAWDYFHDHYGEL